MRREAPADLYQPGPGGLGEPGPRRKPPQVCADNCPSRYPSRPLARGTHSTARGRGCSNGAERLRATEIVFDPPDLDGRMPRASKWGP
jgi:hypothetical protein